MFVVGWPTAVLFRQPLQPGKSRDRHPGRLTGRPPDDAGSTPLGRRARPAPSGRPARVRPAAD
ncbi:hypothetical protein DLJ57_19315, partial [Micromonospora chalcea]